MPPRAAHIEQARLNREHARFLLASAGDQPVARQWAVTAAFYCAVHCIEAHLADFGEDSERHSDRNRNIADARFGIDPDVRSAYRVLYNWSRQARYEMGRFSQDDLQRLVLGDYLPRVTRLVNL